MYQGVVFECACRAERKSVGIRMAEITGRGKKENCFVGQNFQPYRYGRIPTKQ
jgi:hypothetical protein